MGHWSVPQSGRTRESAYRSRILASTSGNAQSFSASSKSHQDSINLSLNAIRCASEPQYPLPCNTLKSNDKQAINDRLAAHKARRSSQPNPGHLRDKPYLTNEKYLSYRQRKRQDAGKDGRPVWPDHVEESFQNALIHIPPMGKKKKTQYGKAYGRNELIKEWIYQETGEVRDRKQVSSHIQVLNNLLKDVPEWRAVVIHEHDDDDDDAHTDNGPDYYFESIADQVRLQRELQAQASKGGQESSFDYLFQRQSLSKLSFEMWVGMPERVTQSLHNYTRISSTQHEFETILLEDHKNWRTLFPDLETLLLSAPGDGFDIIFVKSRLSLMSDFPPLTSKLGLVLDLDFRDSDRTQVTGGIKYFSSINHMYLNGQQFRSMEHRDCQATEPGVVKPVFEAEWWAAQFTDLTHRKKNTDKPKGESTVADINAYSQDFFRGLTIMQEVFASSHAGDDLMSPRRRVAILLWTFAQTSEGHDGITTWQKALPPSNRRATNSPSSDIADTFLPPLGLDSVVEDLVSPGRIANKSSKQNGHVQFSLSPALHQSNPYHSGFTPIQTTGEDQLRIFDFSNGTGFTPKPFAFTDIKQEQFDICMSTEIVPIFEQTQALTHEPNHSTTFLEIQPNRAYDEQGPRLPSPYQMSAPSLTVEQSRRRPLATFDVSTHQMLQQQLGGLDDEYEAHETQRDLNSQQLMIGHMNDLELTGGHLSQARIETAASNLEPLDHEEVALEHPAIFASPRLARPPLMAHNSFAGVLHISDPNEPLCFDTPARNEFARLMQSQFESQSSDSILHNSRGITDQLQMPNDVTRPRSQPILPSNDMDGLVDVNFTTPTQDDQSVSEIKVAEDW